MKRVNEMENGIIETIKSTIKEVEYINYLNLLAWKISLEEE